MVAGWYLDVLISERFINNTSSFIGGLLNIHLFELLIVIIIPLDFLLFYIFNVNWVAQLV
jgi:hypothetical protein